MTNASDFDPFVDMPSTSFGQFDPPRAAPMPANTTLVWSDGSPFKTGGQNHCPNVVGGDDDELIVAGDLSDVLLEDHESMEPLPIGDWSAELPGADLSEGEDNPVLGLVVAGGDLPGDQQQVMVGDDHYDWWFFDQSMPMADHNACSVMGSVATGDSQLLTSGEDGSGDEEAWKRGSGALKPINLGHVVVMSNGPGDGDFEIYCPDLVPRASLGRVNRQPRRCNCRRVMVDGQNCDYGEHYFKEHGVGGPFMCLACSLIFGDFRRLNEHKASHPNNDCGRTKMGKQGNC